jgi:hypothetical protein
MELYWNIVPFITPLILLVVAYKMYKNKKNGIEEDENQSSWLERYSWYRYIKLVFVTRVRQRPWTVLLFLPLFLSSIFGFVTLINNLKRVAYPPVQLNQMQTKQGVVKNIILRKKMDDLLVFKTLEGTKEEYAFRTTKQDSKKYINKKVTIFFTPGWSSAFTIDQIIYEIREKNRILYPYNYQRHLEVNELFWKISYYSLGIAACLVFLLWLANRKELPIHRLNRIKNKQKMR